jgi:hypothetical protein
MVVTNISTVEKISRHMDATMFAAQGIEIMFARRNTNLYKELPWNCLIDVETVTRDNICKQDINKHIDAGDDKLLTVEIGGPNSDKFWAIEEIDVGPDSQLPAILDATRIYMHIDTVDDQSITRFDHNKDGQELGYGRYISFAKLENDHDAVRMTAHVLRRDGSQIRETTMSTILGRIIE